TNKAIIFRGRPVPTGFENMRDSANEPTHDNLLTEWTRIELMVISCTIIIIIVNLVMVFEVTNSYFAYTEDDGSLFRSLLDVFFVTPIALFLMFGISYLQRFFKKKVILSESPSTLNVEETAEDDPTATIKVKKISPWEHASQAFLLFL